MDESTSYPGLGPQNVVTFVPGAFRVGQVVTHKTQPYLRMVVVEALHDPAAVLRGARQAPAAYMCSWLTPDGRRLDRFLPSELLGAQE
jgi:hypothetical protein